MRKRRKLFVCEKQSQLQYAMKTLSEEGDFAILAPNLVHKFDYMKDIKLTDTPVIKNNPCYINNLNLYSNYGYIVDHNLSKYELKEFKNLFISISNKYGVNGGDKDKYFEVEHKRCLDNVHEFLNSFQEIIYACNSDYSGTRAFQLHFELYFNLYDVREFCDSNNVKLSFIKFKEKSKTALIQSFESRESLANNNIYEYLMNTYRKKDYFEYNYNLNSGILFNEILRKIGLQYNDFLITKNIIHTLFLVKEKAQINKNSLLKTMSEKGIGKSSTLIKILESLIQHSLLIECSLTISGKQSEYLMLSNYGTEFIQHLHPCVYNDSLTNTLKNDTLNKDLTLPKFIEKYNIYINETFDLQKKHFRKIVLKEILKEEQELKSDEIQLKTV